MGASRIPTMSLLKSITSLACMTTLAGCVSNPRDQTKATRDQTSIHQGLDAEKIRAQLEAAIGKTVAIHGIAVRSTDRTTVVLEVAKGIRIRISGNPKEGQMYYTSGILQFEDHGPSEQYAVYAGYFGKSEERAPSLEISPEVAVETPMNCGNDEKDIPGKNSSRQPKLSSTD